MTCNAEAHHCRSSTRIEWLLSHEVCTEKFEGEDGAHDEEADESSKVMMTMSIMMMVVVVTVGTGIHHSLHDEQFRSWTSEGLNDR